MKENHRNKMAEAAAGVRAAHYLYNHPLIFDDPLAIHLTSASWRIIAKNRFLYWLVVKRLLAPLLPIHGEVLARSRYTEACLEEAIADGLNQYVLLGAGLDSFALRRRDLTDVLMTYELDHPTTQQIKRERLARINTNLPLTLEFIPIDFEQETIASVLSGSSFSQNRPAFFSWLGVVPYLTRDTIFNTLRSLSSFASPDSQLVFDYGIPQEQIEASEQPAIQALRKFTQRRGEPLLTELDPHTLADDVAACGFELIENLSSTEQMTRYFANRKDYLRPLAGSYFARLRVCK